MWCAAALQAVEEARQAAVQHRPRVRMLQPEARGLCTGTNRRLLASRHSAHGLDELYNLSGTSDVFVLPLL